SRKQRDILHRDSPVKNEFVDRQLQKGLEYLNSQLSGGEKKTEDKPEGDKKDADAKPNADAKVPQEPEKSKKPESDGKDKSGAQLREDEIKIRFLKAHPARAT